MFCIMRTEKRKRTDIGGIQRENTRTATEYNNKVAPGMDIFNVTLKESNDWLQDINREIQAAGAKARSNSVLALDTIYTASPDFFQGKTNAENDKFFQDCLKFHNEHFGHIISAVIHYDETTPHLHVVSVPLTKDGRLSARDVIGNKSKMSKTQDSFFEQVGRGYGLERGIHMDGQEKKQHISAQEHELREIKQEIAREKEHLEAIEHSEETARTRAQEYRRTAAKLQKEVEQLQEERQAQHKSLLQLTEAANNKQKEVKHLNYTLQEKRDEFETITADIKQASRNLEEISGYLSRAEQNRAQEIANKWDDWENNFTL
jgi:phage host-nuclease inhibitor protein Gam